MEMRAAGRAAGRTLQCRQRLVDGGPSAGWGLRARCARPGCRPTIPTTWPRFAPQLVSSWDASRSLSSPRRLYSRRAASDNLVADTGAAASRQPDFPRAGVAYVAAATPRVRILEWDASSTRSSKREDQILATATESRGNATTTIAARYVVGCDGAHSSSPALAIGAVVLQGDAAVLQAQTSSSGLPSLWQ